MRHNTVCLFRSCMCACPDITVARIGTFRARVSRCYMCTCRDVIYAQVDEEFAEIKLFYACRLICRMYICRDVMCARAETAITCVRLLHVCASAYNYINCIACTRARILPAHVLACCSVCRCQFDACAHVSILDSHMLGCCIYARNLCAHAPAYCLCTCWDGTSACAELACAGLRTCVYICM